MWEVFELGKQIFDIFESSVVDNPMARRTGCTATVAMIAGDQLHVAQAGMFIFILTVLCFRSIGSGKAPFLSVTTNV